jgi:hypothetical protein
MSLIGAFHAASIDIGLGRFRLYAVQLNNTRRFFFLRKILHKLPRSVAGSTADITNFQVAVACQIYFWYGNQKNHDIFDRVQAAGAVAIRFQAF